MIILFLLASLELSAIEFVKYAILNMRKSIEIKKNKW